LIPLSRLCGQEGVKRAILDFVNRNRPASAYLFYGREGVGKWQAAVCVAALLNCDNRVVDEDGRVIDFCGVCRNCIQVLNLGFPEMHIAMALPPFRSESEGAALSLEFLEEKKKEPYKIITSSRQTTIPIQTAREIKRKTAIKPGEGTKRLIIFYQMEKMLPASADSLLKLIEEPPPETVIIMTARDPGNLLPTIQSRAHKVRFGPISESEIVRYISDRYDEEADKLELIAGLSEGSLGRALELISDESASSLRQVSFYMFKGLFVKETSSAIATLIELLNPNDRGQGQVVLSHWQSFISDLIVIKYGREGSEIVNKDLRLELEKLAGHIYGYDQIGRMEEVIRDVLISLGRNAHMRLAFAALAFRLRDRIYLPGR